MQLRSTISNFNWPVFLVMVVLVAIGIAFVYSATRPDLPGKYYDPFLLQKHIIWVTIGFGVFFLLLIIPYTFLMRLSYPFYMLCLLLLIATPFIGKEINNAKSWINLGPVHIQPSELMKIAFILAFARYLMYRKNYKRLQGLIMPFVLTLVPVFLIVRQPDLGTAMLFLPILFSMLYIAGAKPKHILTILGLGVACIPLFYFFVLNKYQQDRIIAFLNPMAHVKGKGYQLVQSLIAIGSGGPFGQGFAQGAHSKLGFVPLSQNDFIFSVIAEETGFFGAGIVIVLFFLLVLLGCEIAVKTREPFGKLVAFGAVSMLGVQAFLNIGVALGLLPTTGVTLPFISYGGSSLLTCFIAMALLLNVGMRRVPVLASHDFD